MQILCLTVFICKMPSHISNLLRNEVTQTSNFQTSLVTNPEYGYNVIFYSLVSYLFHPTTGTDSLAGMYTWLSDESMYIK